MCRTCLVLGISSFGDKIIILSVLFSVWTFGAQRSEKLHFSPPLGDKAEMIDGFGKSNKLLIAGVAAAGALAGLLVWSKVSFAENR